jgi:hypothetical protein
VYGLGFADAFHEAVGSVTDFAAVPLSFSAGLESGQLVVVLLAIVVMGRFWERSWYRRAVVDAGIGRHRGGWDRVGGLAVGGVRLARGGSREGEGAVAPACTAQVRGDR